MGQEIDLNTDYTWSKEIAEQKERMVAWKLTAKTTLFVGGWKEPFKDARYTGAYLWLKP